MFLSYSVRVRQLLLIVICLFCWQYVLRVAAYGQERELLEAEVISSKDGLPQAFVPGITQDQQGFIWMATRDGLCRYDGKNFRTFQPDPRGKPSLSFTGLIKMLPDPKGRLWILTEKGTVDLFYPRTEKFVNISKKPQFRRHLMEKYGYDIFIDNQSRLWVIRYDKGFYRFDFNTGKTDFFKMPPSAPRATREEPSQMAQDSNGTIWMASNRSLFYLDEARKKFEVCQLPDLNRLLGSDLEVRTLQVDRQSGRLLIGTSRSLIYVNDANRTFREVRLPAGLGAGQVKAVSDANGNMYLADKQLLLRVSAAGLTHIIADFHGHDWDSRSFWIDKSQVLWVGTSGSGVRKFNLRGNQFRSFPYTGGFYSDWLTITLEVPRAKHPVYPKFSTSYHFRYTSNPKRGKIWYSVGGEPAAVYSVRTGDRQIDRTILPQIQNVNAHYYPLAEDPLGDIYIFYNSSFFKYSDVSKRFEPTAYRVNVQKTGVVIQIVADKNYFWLCTSDNGLFRLDRKTGNLTHYAHDPARAFTLSGNALFCIFPDPADANRLWIGTFGSGLCAFDKTTGKSKRLSTGDGLPNNVIYFAIPDAYGSLWVGTNKGLSQVNRKTFKVRNYTTEDGLAADEFNRFHYLQMPDGRILVGGIEGLTAFHPKYLKDDPFSPSVELVGMQINNRTVLTGENPFIGDKPLQTLTELTLPYNQNFLTFEYASLQFNETSKKFYRHQLVGVDHDWIESSEPKAVYTELRPGTYQLKLNAANTSGIWSTQLRTVSIKIEPPFWATWWAYSFYAAAFASLMFWLFRIYANRLQMKQENELRRREAEQLRMADAMKTRFFSNITHEFRTPLTLIMTPAEQLKMKLKDQEDQNKLTSINRSANHLLELINQLLDLSRLEAGALPVHEVRGDLASFVAQTVQLFEQKAEEKYIRLTFENLNVTGHYFFDADKIERIIQNLVFNALKFTGKNGQVVVLICVGEDGAFTIRVNDTGIGIPKDKLSAIFNRFYQVDESSPGGSGQGTGIGLSLVKEIIDLLNGQINVESEPGKGTSFEVSLPLKLIREQALPATDVAKTEDTSIAEDFRTFHVLVVEDNEELLNYIVESLPAHYRVSRAYNGREGLDMAVEQIPDLIISDIMMPEMDGLTLCIKLKSDLLTSHVPVILLTAKTTFEDKMAGLETGADEYLSKPFKVRELQLRVQNLLANRNKQREWIRADLSSLQKKPVQPQIKDKFLIGLYELIDLHLDDSTFGVEQLSDRMGISRIHLYRKIKTLTGFTATEFLRNYRLKQSVMHLRSGYSVAEAGNMVGFDTPSYFTKCFRELYGVTPTEFLAKQASTD